jgi:hypothetical protein
MIEKTGLRSRRPKFRSWVVGVLLAGPIGLTACSSSPSTTPSTTGAAPTSTSLGTVLRVAPTTNLHYGEVVQVSMSGFPPGKAFLSECASVTDVTTLGCGAQLAAQPFVEIESGAGTESFKVSDQAPSTPLSPEPTASCTNQCVLVATSGANPSDTKHIATAKLVFGS